MSDDLTVPKRDDARTIWVFTAALDPVEFEVFSQVGDTYPLAEALGLPGLGPASVETFLGEDIAEYGLDRYLTEAHGMDHASVAPEAARLTALRGPVVLLFARDLPAGIDRLDPRPPLAFVGRYDARDQLAPAAPHLSRDSTEGFIPGPAGPTSGPRLLAPLLMFTLTALIALAALVVWLA